MTTPTELDKELDHKLLLLFQRMSVCAATHQGNDDEWIDGQCVTPSLAAKEAKALVNSEVRQVLDRLKHKSIEPLYPLTSSELEENGKIEKEIKRYE